MKLSNKLLVVLILITLLLIFIIPANADYVSLNPIADSYVSSSAPDSNYGSSQTLRVGANYKTLLRFDLSQCQGKRIAYARLKIKVSGGSDYANAIIELHRILSDWNESEVTYNTLPSYSNEVAANITISSIGTWYEFDLTDEVQYLVDHPNENYGWILVWNSDLSGYISIISREGADKPVLEVYYIEATETTTTVTTTVTTTETVTSATTETVTETATQTVTETQANATITTTTTQTVTETQTATMTATITQPATTYTTTVYSTKALTQPSSVDMSSTMSLISSILPILLLVGIVGALARSVRG